jgi:hypothetical protein
VVAVAGAANISLWDAYSGTFLGVLSSFGAKMELPGEIDCDSGLPMDPLTGRAASGPNRRLPDLGTDAEEMMPREDTSVVHKFNSAATVASSVTSTFAKKCARTSHVHCMLLVACMHAVAVHALSHSAVGPLHASSSPQPALGA